MITLFNIAAAFGLAVATSQWWPVTRRGQWLSAGFVFSVAGLVGLRLVYLFVSEEPMEIDLVDWWGELNCLLSFVAGWLFAHLMRRRQPSDQTTA